ncbi:cobalamin binding protein [Acetobacter indonesiensis NRIC 0313]|uniref:B12-binding domain-containing radical SAM protein n=1 Tax=Acetobacter indonesiensis TaxID=104101 RepID=A0A6N3T6I7_9PROT|nr:hopanoid C-3 methylase HpnR [Acetobacter indonesiensis]GAN63406.1 cobalamin (vitamin B12) binding protein [Acetobacter indonesiensis]GBQ61268.1 cobalamin binding protein [Acetobacter indonesiensis NRIC 0313]GEN03524.1 B12-binding domain-containing radical SAM protein [Acetobacter indonesiensis]
MKILAVHPSALMYTKVFLRLEPLGLELVAGAARDAGHDVRIIDLQVEKHKDYWKLLHDFKPDAVCFSGSYLANIPEIIDLCRATRLHYPTVFQFIGGHSVSFIARDVLSLSEGAVNCILKGEGDASIGTLLKAVEDGTDILDVPGVVTMEGEGPPPTFVKSLDDIRPARDLLRHRNKYFIGTLDPAASIEFARGCPWDCTFCSAWTFYGRSYRTASPQVIADELEAIKEPGIFIVDDVAFVHEEHGMAIANEIKKRGIKKEYYLETRADVLLRNKEVFKVWSEIGLSYIFIGLEAVDEEGLKQFRKRVSLDKNFEALEYARSLGLIVAINIIADPSWDRSRFEAVRQWCLEIPEIVNISVTTPYPGTEIWHKEARRLTTRDYRLFDIQHAVLPTKLPLPEFYEELVKTQQVLNTKHMGWQALKDTAGIAGRLLLKGQTNFVKMLWKFNSVFNPKLQLADHMRKARYLMPIQPDVVKSIDRKDLYVHGPGGRKTRALDDDTEQFVDKTRMGEDA